MSSAFAGLLRALPIYVMAATALGFVDYRTRAHIDRGYDAYSQGVVANTEEPPGKYRVLAPFAFEGLVRVTGLERREAWVAFRWVGLLAALVAMHALLTTWFSLVPTVAGSLLAGVLLLLTFTNSWPHPDHIPELVFAAAAAAAIARGADGWFLIWFVLAAFNRETSAFLWLLYVTASPLDSRRLTRAGAFGAIWVAIYAGIRAWRGVAWYDPWQISRNLDFLGLLPPAYDPYFRGYAWFWVIMIVPVGILFTRTWASQPRFARAGMVVVVPAFVLTALCFSSIVETRIFTPLIPILSVAVMAALRASDTVGAQDFPNHA